MQNAYHLNDSVNFTQAIDIWLKEKHYPEVYVQRDIDSNTTICYLSSFNFGTYMEIPITYFTKSTIEFYNISNVTWLNSYQGITIPNIKGSDFIIVNIKQMGEYSSMNDRNRFKFKEKNHICMILLKRKKKQ